MLNSSYFWVCVGLAVVVILLVLEAAGEINLF
jgi:hypothetical protein